MSGKSPKQRQRTGTFNAAFEQHERLLSVGPRSVPGTDGTVGIIFSADTKRDLEVLEAHAQVLRKRFEANNNVSMHGRPTGQELVRVLTDRQICSVVMLGHGALGTMRIYTPGTHSYKHWNWYDTAKVVEHLKTGFFEQRTCAMVHDPEKHVRVPIGTFLMEDQSRILAPVGHSFGPNAGAAQFDPLMHPVYAKPVNSRAELLEPRYE